MKTLVSGTTKYNHNVKDLNISCENLFKVLKYFDNVFVCLRRLGDQQNAHHIYLIFLRADFLGAINYMYMYHLVKKNISNIKFKI